MVVFYYRTDIIDADTEVFLPEGKLTIQFYLVNAESDMSWSQPGTGHYAPSRGFLLPSSICFPRLEPASIAADSPL
ncbi:unnamed protein product [Nezara viridula]|uniref:Uncharacterized protein n=1 Tax=Nezara viridula TaxID=85310 RepID=A0A9P0MUA3_NEZVI|nr:unnamed protein product [Nezara viridula]